MMRKKSKKLGYRELKPLIKGKFKDYLRKKEETEGLVLPKEFQGKFGFEAYSEPGDDNWFKFHFMVVAAKPEDAIMILEADVSRIDASISNWRCHDDAFVTAK